eukprot:gnl/Dysnectes_brevis/5962_a8907_356.p1 GENE.gnl/Dysnectes_brevis/5962_a8907_356~~gnl/Dysnectes_brevis/5962_a8907_356.p1  ORF type:complete len:182 (-),score=25.19 gnl/Dysnectes_brevis/5962_a8907_356:459-1004(-)
MDPSHLHYATDQMFQPPPLSTASPHLIGSPLPDSSSHTSHTGPHSPVPPTATPPLEAMPELTQQSSCAILALKTIVMDRFLQEWVGDIALPPSRRLPLSRIRAVMKTNPNVHMVSAVAPVLLGKCAELFIAEITRRACYRAMSAHRKTVGLPDIVGALGEVPEFDFLRMLFSDGIVNPREE